MNVFFSQTTLYNTRLKNKLDIEDSEYTDDDLLFFAYQKWGKKLALHLDGEFSFALYDQNKNYYFCARDPLGIKSLYFTKLEEKYRFSSNIDELLNLHDVSKKPNLKSLKTMLYKNVVDYTDTMYEDIYRLPPGHFMSIENGQVHIERYWYPEKIEIDYTITEDEAANKLKELLLKAIDKRIFNLDETAFEVSGGLDSSSVVSLLGQNASSSKIDSYSLEFKGLKCDEGIYVDSILDRYSLSHQKISVEKLDYKRTYSLESVYALSSNWPITLTFSMMLPMYERMKNDGKKVIITGQGGDHLFTGSSYILYDLFRRLKLLTIYNEVKVLSKPWQGIKSGILKHFLGEKNVKLLKKTLRKEETKSFSEQISEIQNLFQTEHTAGLALKDDVDNVTSAYHSTMMDGNGFHTIENYFDIEFRHPFFDLELVEFALSLPPEFKYRNGKIKWILRKAMEGILPDKINERKDKAEFSEMIIQQIDAIDIGALLDDSYIVKLGITEKTFIDKVRKEYENKTGKHTLLFWRIINLEYWYRYNFEKESLVVNH